MNIAHVVPYSVTFPQLQHNGRYDWVLQLASLQASAGHAVTIYCNPASQVDGIMIASVPRASDDKKQNNLALFAAALSQPHDIYHSHFDELHYEVAHQTTKPVVYTQHWWPKQTTLQLAQNYAKSNVWAIAPTRFMRDFNLASGIATKGFIHHGIDLEFFTPTDTTSTGRLLFIGRISPEKNLPLALSVAKKSGVGLDIIGKLHEKNHDYWQELLPLIDGEQIRYLGPKSKNELRHAYSQASGVLFPSDIHEAFGLVAIEAQACGTPVLMKKGGSRGELIIDGTTGFLCESEDDFVAAINTLDTVNAADCVGFARNFAVHAMAVQYETLYEQLIGRS